MPNKSVAACAIWRSSLNRHNTDVALGKHLEASYRWICAAQDASGNGGVAGWYDLRKGWAASYPETTGYIIPSLLAYADVAKEDDARRRAVRMADWEITIQLPSGAVHSSLMGGASEPAVFNTGQVIAGWTTLHRATGKPCYAEAAGRAANWLTGVQDGDGAWRKHLSRWTSSKVQAYNVRAAWALAQAGVVLGEPGWVDAARRNCDWVMTQQDASGWFANNVFRPGEDPLLHTICYVIEGLFGTGVLMGEERYIESAGRATEGLLGRFEKDRRTHGRYGPGWLPRASWRCLTGDAQFAGILLRLAKYAGHNSRHKVAAEAITRGVCGLQDMNPRRTPTYGGVPGSQPIWGEYLRYRYPNWAAKFHMDALLLLLHDVDPHNIR